MKWFTPDEYYSSGVSLYFTVLGGCMSKKKREPMTRENFELALNSVKQKIQDRMKTALPPREMERLEVFLRVLNDYTYETRLRDKGLIGYGVIDSALWETGIRDIGQELLRFDQNLH